jgi:hypothetical protein
MPPKRKPDSPGSEQQPQAETSSPSPSGEPSTQGRQPDHIREIEALLQEIRSEVAAVEPLAARLSEQQIDKLLNQRGREKIRDSQDRRLAYYVMLALGILLLVAICFVWSISLFYGATSLVSDLIKMLGGLAGGLLGGYGIGRATRKKPERRMPSGQ